MSRTLLGMVMLFAGLLGACQAPPLGSAANTCSVAPPVDVKSNPKAAAEAAVDLTKLAKLPMSANFKAEVSNTVAATFQKVPDTAAACAMLNQTYVCIREPERAKQYLEFMSETKQCAVK